MQKIIKVISILNFTTTLIFVINEGFERNTLSWFVGQALKLLEIEDLIIVSYADSGMKHCGYIYKATNWIYTGATKERTDNYVPL